MHQQLVELLRAPVHRPRRNRNHGPRFPSSGFFSCEGGRRNFNSTARSTARAESNDSSTFATHRGPPAMPNGQQQEELIMVMASCPRQGWSTYACRYGSSSPASTPATPLNSLIAATPINMVAGSSINMALATPPTTLVLAEPQLAPPPPPLACVHPSRPTAAVTRPVRVHFELKFHKYAIISQNFGFHNVGDMATKEFDILALDGSNFLHRRWISK